jgi:hypothetical protein
MTMERMVKHPTDTAQHELVHEYCKKAEGRIKLARSHGEAIKIKEEWCNRFRRECESDLLINATSAYLDAIIRRQWKENRT